MRRGAIIALVILGIIFFGLFVYLPIYWNYILPNKGYTEDKNLRQLDVISDGNTTYESYYPRPPRPTHLYAINDSDCSGEVFVTILTLQGVLAKTEPKIYISDGGFYGKWVELIRQEGIEVEEVHDPWALVQKFANNVTGYILYKKDNPGDNPSDPYLSLDTVTYQHKDESYLVATSLCGILNAIAVEEEDEQKVIDMGLKKVFDARGKDVDWIFNGEYWDKFRHDMIFEVEHHSARRFCLIDYAIFAGAPIWHAQSQDDRAEYLKYFDADSPSFGWGAVIGDEGSLNLQVSVAGGFFMPSDWARDLSVFSAIPVECKQKPLPTIQPEDNVHYVTILLSDGDNLQWFLSGYDSDSFFGNVHRGSFPMGWMMPPAVADLAPLILRYYYQKANATDRFIAGNSGHGLFYPTKDPWQAQHVARSCGIFERADINTVVIQDWGWNKESFESTTALNCVRGVFYNDYRQYALQSGKIMWVNSKPCISMTYNFWVGFDSASKIASEINSGSRDIRNPTAYSVIVVHAWTHNLDDVYDLVQMFDSDVRVVDPENFLNLMSINLMHINYEPDKIQTFLLVFLIGAVIITLYWLHKKGKLKSFFPPRNRQIKDSENKKE